ncbi:ricin-type beta-trefoil lectin domain protein [Streptomyces flaveus]|uniref:ricin-type beta-trefoil lectin domain protein n=1 Tax=Streptomyces flaveus TaxID=66370 RepID=UPI00166FA1E6|nr:ricin-type beta-trefoil lectin domain protein [Streptomyces flaveus]
MSDATDEQLLARHWAAVHSYARLCTSSTQYAGMLTTAAFTRAFGEYERRTGSTVAWLPRLLVTVRGIAAEWDADHRRSQLHPDLHSGPEDGDRATARLLPPENRRLVSRAFQELPEPARCILWHAEVEAEDLAIPAELLGLTAAEAPAQLERARDLLRAGTLEAHSELAPREECRRYNRLLDASLRRGSDTCRDLLRHMNKCGYCRYAADQLDQSGGRLPVLLAEAVLGWGARPYLDSRPGRRARFEEAQAGPVVARAPTGPLLEEPPPGPVVAVTSGESWTAEPAGAYHHEAQASPYPDDPTEQHFGLPPTEPHPAEPHSLEPRRRSRGRRTLALAALAVSAGVAVSLALWAGDRDDTRPPSDAGTGTVSRTPGSQAPGADPSRAGSDDSPSGTVSGRLRNAGNDLCVGIAGSKAVKDAEAVLTTCTSSARQQWSYESNGLLRSLDVPELCLDSRLASSVRLGKCEGRTKKDTKNVRYDLTLDDSLVPLARTELALTPAAPEGKTDLVLKTRDDSEIQHWQFDTSVDSLQMEWINAYTDGDSPEPTRSARPTPGRTPSPTPTPTPTPSESTPTPDPDQPCYGYFCPNDGSDDRYDGGGDGGYGFGGGGYGFGGYGGADGRR